MAVNRNENIPFSEEMLYAETANGLDRIATHLRVLASQPVRALIFFAMAPDGTFKCICVGGRDDLLEQLKAMAWQAWQGPEEP